ncbi:PHA/PHB synthase family protein [Nocardioides sp. LML1-1-1.1]|uniref:PHA/PHB synthase family protein n=1 Tax=Nocardioides sp. LML1-1-1.1 TaxID=3135248 RepID=UPI00343A51AC
MTTQVGASAESTVDNVLGQQVMGDFRPSDLFGTARSLLAQGIRRPGVAAATTAGFLAELPAVLAGTSDRTPAHGDRRFADPAWQDNPFYRRLLLGYLSLQGSLHEYALRSGGSEREQERRRFLLDQVGNAVAPTNFLLGNPQAIRTALDTRGLSLLRGGRNLLGDAWHRRPLPSTVDESEFEVGGNLAVTPGAVVLRTEMFELIQYAAQTPTVRARPVLLVPSIVNKYYVFDLAPGRSVVEHMVQQGLTVLVLVWRNPQKRHDRWGMAQYQDAVDTGIDAARAITGADKVNLWAVCGAGPVVVSLAAYDAARGADRISSLLLVVSPLDTEAMSHAPGIGAFIDKDEPAVPEALGKAAAGRRMSARDFTLLFAMLRSNEMIWSAWVNGYLLGKKPPAFDVLYWNADGTGMTAGFNRDFSAFVEDNPFVTPGAMTVRGEPIADIGALGFDSFVLGARNDHLCIWQGVHRSAQLLGPSTEFVLGNSGHIQTIVSPLDSPKASYSTGPAPTGTPEEWLAASEAHQGSWWPHYVAWVTERSGPEVGSPSEPGDADHPPLGDAPGTYVHERA